MKLPGFFAIAACSAVLLITSSCSSSKKTVKVKPGPFAKTPIVVDGNDNDWPSPYPWYDSKAMVSYAVSNDRDMLYLSVKANERRIMMKILKGGMKVWIDTSGNKEEYMSIQSPMPGAMKEHSEDEPTRQQMMADTDPKQRGDASGWRKQAMLGAEQFSLTGFGACDGNYGTSEAVNNCGVQVKLGINDYNELVWEAAIPVKTWHRGPLTARDAGKPISICFEIAGLKMAPRTYGGQSGGHAGGGGGGHMGGGGGGGMHGGGGGRMGQRGGGGGTQRGAGADEAEALSHTTKTYVKTGIALH